MGAHLRSMTLPSACTEVLTEPVLSKERVPLSTFFFFFFPVCLACDAAPGAGAHSCPRHKPRPEPRRGKQTLAITQFSRVSSALCFGIVLPGAGALSSNPSRRQVRLRLLKSEGGMASPVLYATRPTSYILQ